MRACGRDVYGVVSWNLGDRCNYRCTYCTQGSMSDRSGTLRHRQIALDAFADLPGCWEVKLSGGEPMIQAGFLAVCAGLISAGHLISIQTNLSVDDALLSRFFTLTHGRLHVFSVSLHLDYADPAVMAARLVGLRGQLAAGVHINVTSVATAARLVELRDRVAPIFAAAGIPFKVQPEKVAGRVRSYSVAEQGILAQLGGHNLTGMIAPDFQGRLCHAGSRYLVVKSDGRVFRCYPASRLGGRHARLGHLGALQRRAAASSDGIGRGDRGDRGDHGDPTSEEPIKPGFQRLDGPQLCPYPYCNCTVPIHRGMVAGVGRRLEE